MSEINKKELSETDICDLFITPAVKDAGWDPIKQIRREVTLTPGPIVVRGNMSSRNKKRKSPRLKNITFSRRIICPQSASTTTVSEIK